MRTLIIIKPDAYSQRAHVRTLLEHEGFTIVRSKEFTFTPELAAEFYKEHAGRPYFDGLVAFTTSGPVEAMELERIEAVSHLRRLMGDTYPERARPGSLRALFGQGVPNNGTHGSDSAAAADRELTLIFGTVTGRYVQDIYAQVAAAMTAPLDATGNPEAPTDSEGPESPDALDRTQPKRRR